MRVLFFFCEKWGYSFVCKNGQEWSWLPLWWWAESVNFRCGLGRLLIEIVILCFSNIISLICLKNRSPPRCLPCCLALIAPKQLSSGSGTPAGAGRIIDHTPLVLRVDGTKSKILFCTHHLQKGFLQKCNLSAITKFINDYIIWNPPIMVPYRGSSPIGPCLLRLSTTLVGVGGRESSSSPWCSRLSPSRQVARKRVGFDKVLWQTHSLGWLVVL
jgi:hypothetical protein